MNSSSPSSPATQRSLDYSDATPGGMSALSRTAAAMAKPTTTSAATTTTTTAAALPARPLLHTADAQPGGLLALAGRPQTDMRRIGHYVDQMLAVFDVVDEDAQAVPVVALVVRQVIDQDARHALVAMYGAARALKKEQVLMYAFNFGMASHRGHNALGFAALMGHANVVKDLCALGVPLESRNPQNGRTPLILAAIGGHDRVVAILLGHGAAAGARDAKNLTALDHARQWARKGSMLSGSSMHEPSLGMNWDRCVSLLEQAGAGLS